MNIVHSKGKLAAKFCAAEGPRVRLNISFLATLVASLFCGLGPLPELSAAQFLVEGIMSTTSLNAPGAKVSDKKTYMQVVVNGCSWRITWKQPHLPYHSEYGCDGTNVYSLVASPRGAGSIDAGTFPISASPDVVIVYLAYASTCFLSSNSGEIPIMDVVERYQKSEMRATRKASWVLLPEKRGLVCKLTYHGNTAGRFKDLPVDFTYEELISTNFIEIGEALVPRNVDYLHNGVLWNSTANKHYVVPTFQHSFVATNITSEIGECCVPEISAGRVLADNRYSNKTNAIPPILLTTVTNSWPTEAEVKATPSYQKKARAKWDPPKRRVRTPNVGWRGVFIGLLALSVPILFLIVRKTKVDKNH